MSQRRPLALAASIRLSGLVALAIAHCLAGCGRMDDVRAEPDAGAPMPEMDADGPSDALDALETSDAPVPFDDGVEQCGKGPCVTGRTCYVDDCNRATCLADGSWSYTKVCDAAPSCPAAAPDLGDACTLEGRACSYMIACGYAPFVCTGGRWLADGRTCLSCPASEPANGAPCDTSAITSCSYPSGCGGFDRADCGSSGFHVYGACDGCPRVEPLNGSRCAVEELWKTCSYPNACGTQDVGTCVNYHWKVDVQGCTPPGCPVAVPTHGDPCSVPGKTCYWPCDRASCTAAGWEVTENTCEACPLLEPAENDRCAPNTLSCKSSNRCGTTDWWYCNGGYWQLRVEGPCAAPSCPLLAPTVGTACPYPAMTCSYANACGGVDGWVCSGTWQRKSPSSCP
jgi:hypothetical protein